VAELPTKNADELWEKIKKIAGQDVKRHLTTKYSDQILTKYGPKINGLISKYLASLPGHVISTEGDDLANVARIEFFETLKAWDPERSTDVWPLAYSRITGAMRDQIRYVTKASPARLYNWITEASYVYMTVEEDATFENKIESGVVLNEAMRQLDRREKFIVISRFKHDRTFKEIGDMIGLSESQTTRIYKTIMTKLKKIVVEKGVQKSDT
jgi:RNA polymerase sigma factor (sigma-70 family)